MISEEDILDAGILIVDDQDANILLLERTLRGAGYTSVTSTKNPHEVCELYFKHRYTLILLDLQMPDLDGFQVMEQLKSIEKGDYLPVLVQTGQPTHLLLALQAGARDFVSKPLNLAEVRLRVHHMIEVRLLHKEAKERTEQAEAKELEIRRLNETLEDRVRVRTAQLEDTNRELQAFSYSVSHDLRAPLRHVLGFVQLLKKSMGSALSEENAGYLATISEAANRMGTLIDDLLAFAKLGQTAVQKTEVDLNAMVTEVRRNLHDETVDRQIVWDIRSLAHVRADPSLLRMVLTNLIANAIKFTGTRNPAEIEIGVTERKPNEVVTYIRDNGAGFDPQYTNKLFGVFQRLHSREEFEGTGIGLANVRRIIHRHGGNAWAEGMVDKGATFYFSLPA